MRGRNNNNSSSNNGNRKSPNPLQRSYESNGPDVKVRGTAQHVAEKYLQLARDAQSSGDPVAAENYFQHAEHYYRILLAAQEQMSQQFGHSFPPNRAFNEDADDGEEEGDDDQFQPGSGPQPELRHGVNGNGYNANSGQRQDGEAGDGQQNAGQRFDRQGRNRPDRFGNDRNGERRFDRNDRPDRGERRFERPDGGQNAPGGYAPRPDAPRSDIPVTGEQQDAAPEPIQNQGERRPERPERGPRPERGERRPRREREAETGSLEDGAGALPSFLTTPVRVPIAVAEEPAPAAAAEVSQDVAEGAAPEGAPADAAPKRPRRRRSPREVMDALGSETDNTTE
jgi:hypothetical protein